MRVHVADTHSLKVEAHCLNCDWMLALPYEEVTKAGAQQHTETTGHSVDCDVTHRTMFFTDELIDR